MRIIAAMRARESQGALRREAHPLAASREVKAFRASSFES